MMQVAQRGAKNQGPVKSPAVEQAQERRVGGSSPSLITI